MASSGEEGEDDVVDSKRRDQQEVDLAQALGQEGTAVSGNPTPKHPHLA